MEGEAHNLLDKKVCSMRHGLEVHSVLLNSKQRQIGFKWRSSADTKSTYKDVEKKKQKMVKMGRGRE